MDQINGLAEEILTSAVKSLSGEFIYFAYPLGKMNAEIKSGVNRVLTNGRTTAIDPMFILSQTAKSGVKGVSSALLHVMLHLIFTHPFKKFEDANRFDLACDIVVSYALDGLGYSFGEKSSVASRKTVYKAIIDSFGGVNDDTANRFAKELNQRELKTYSALFNVCDHSVWAFREREEQEDGQTSVPLTISEDNEEEVEDMSADWGAIARNLIPQLGKLNLELKKMISVGLGIEKDYKKFLKAFLRRKERIIPTDEEFDYIAYYYGLQTYKNMPLIENLVYSERRDFSDIAIAVDTSGSTDGEPIKKLLNEVFYLVKSMETESKKYRIRIIQCDLKIHKEDVVKSVEEFSALLKNYQLIGGGGTDFRPVFDYLTDLKKKGEKIEGLIYFTDGVGVYPKAVPPFKTCFAILNGEESVTVPHFAYKIDIED